MFTVLVDNYSERGCPAAKEGAGRGKGSRCCCCCCFSFKRKVIGVLEGFAASRLRAALLRPSLAVGAKRLSLQFAGRPRQWASSRLPKSWGPDKRCPPGQNWPMEMSEVKWVPLPQPSGLPLGGFQTPLALPVTETRRAWDYLDTSSGG